MHQVIKRTVIAAVGLGIALGASPASAAVTIDKFSSSTTYASGAGTCYGYDPAYWRELDVYTTPSDGWWVHYYQSGPDGDSYYDSSGWAKATSVSLGAKLSSLHVTATVPMTTTYWSTGTQLQTQLPIDATFTASGAFTTTSTQTRTVIPSQETVTDHSKGSIAGAGLAGTIGNYTCTGGMYSQLLKSGDHYVIVQH